MNKKLIICAITYCFAVSGNAQEEDEKENKTDFRERITVGAKAGLNLSNVYDSKTEYFTADAKLGLAAGAFIAIPFGKYFGFQPEILISQKGFRGQGMMFNSPYKFTRTTTYLDVPLLLAIKPTEFITILAGPQYSYLFNQKDAFENTGATIEQETVIKNENIRKNTMCLTGGVDFTLKRMVIGARAGWDVLNNNGNGTSSVPRYKNVWYQATIGFRL